MSTLRVSFDELPVVSERRQLAPAGSATAVPSQDFLSQEDYWQHGFGGRPRLSPEILAVIVAAIDFCLVLTGAVFAFALHFGLSIQSAGDSGRYIWTTLFAATLFVGGFERFGGYRLTRLLKLGWQMTRALAMWGMTLPRRPRVIRAVWPLRGSLQRRPCLWLRAASFTSR
jgi:hypothetical protein